MKKIRRILKLLWAHGLGARPAARACGASHRPVLEYERRATDAELSWEQVAEMDSGTLERRLFHLVNAVREAGRSLLLTARRAPAEWPLRLPDLASRLAACPLARISPPDDELLAAVLAKHFSDRQVLVGPRVIAYLAGRMERSFAEAARLVGVLDRLALADGRAITVPLARAVLRDYIASGAEAGGDDGERGEAG